MTTPNTLNTTDDLDARIARFGRNVAASLTAGSAELPHDVTERLRFAREQALARAAQARAAAAALPLAASTMVQASATLAIAGGPRGLGTSDDGGGRLWAKLVSALPLLALLAGLVLMQQSQIHEQLVAAAEVDTALLSDDLPPSAFADPGFSEYLRDGDGQE